MKQDVSQAKRHIVSINSNKPDMELRIISHQPLKGEINHFISQAGLIKFEIAAEQGFPGFPVCLSQCANCYRHASNLDSDGFSRYGLIPATQTN